ncbi:hypothetical protein BCR43DRAFT_497637 [Syncephalastrum racemosum]|uniref:Uncharacterized protein n=1 Tax=Syncephalastrum racemosum TaxID=13706 RepID=A0A1X2H3Q4_SYNRA|nr:hypothetical protein BCR43DRAFT_497637 [Syncephalastrum racemosum]
MSLFERGFYILLLSFNHLSSSRNRQQLRAYLSIIIIFANSSCYFFALFFFGSVLVVYLSSPSFSFLFSLHYRFCFLQ